jgi:phosphatidylglycerophosphate synthase
MVNEQNNFKSETSFDYKADLIKALYKYISKKIAPIFIRLNISPNTITVISGLFGVLGAVFLISNTTALIKLSPLLLQLYIILDFVDGVVARRTKRMSSFGVWLDIFFDKANDFLIILCLSISIYYSMEEPFYLILGMVLMGSIFFTQFLFLLNYTILKELPVEDDLVGGSNSEAQVDIQNSISYGSELLKIIKVVLSQMSMNHSKFILMVSIIVLLDIASSGMILLVGLSILTLGLNIIKTFNKVRDT